MYRWPRQAARVPRDCSEWGIAQQSCVESTAISWLNLFCMKHSSWGWALLSLERFSEDSQREKFLLQRCDKSLSLPSALLWSVQLRSGWDCRSTIGVWFFLLPLRFLTKRRGAIWKVQWHHFLPLFNSCLGNSSAKFYPIMAQSQAVQLAKSRTTLAIRLWVEIYDEVSFYIHLAPLYCYKQMTVIWWWAGCFKFCWNVSTVLLLAPGIWLV